ncbi:hypothetical protein [Amaricoccus sp.]|uniref:hypothetical protein n=1 Tax=Amaricoccus sp. TaxID=1872485 RepID=UPI001B6EC0ED|nr:hypothetical protein [Amaricoccus sp.]MBP7002502.1 hypothetical protein [Amaricoccus sp.]
MMMIFLVETASVIVGLPPLIPLEDFFDLSRSRLLAAASVKSTGLKRKIGRISANRTLHDRSRSSPEAASLPPTEAGSARDAAARQAKARLSPRRRLERVGA